MRDLGGFLLLTLMGAWPLAGQWRPEPIQPVMLASIGASMATIMVAGAFLGRSGLDGRVAISLAAGAQLAATLYAERSSAGSRPVSTR